MSFCAGTSATRPKAHDLLLAQERKASQVHVEVRDGILVGITLAGTVPSQDHRVERRSAGVQGRDG